MRVGRGLWGTRWGRLLRRQMGIGIVVRAGIVLGVGMGIAIMGTNKEARLGMGMGMTMKRWFRTSIRTI